MQRVSSRDNTIKNFKSIYLCCSIYKIIQNKTKSLLVDAMFAKDPIFNNFINQLICKFSEKTFSHQRINTEISRKDTIYSCIQFAVKQRSPFSCDIKLMLLQLKYIVNSF